MPLASLSQWFDGLFVLILSSPVNNFSVMSGQVFLGLTSTKQRIKCLAEGHNTVPSVSIEPATLQFQVKHSTTETPLSSSHGLASA